MQHIIIRCTVGMRTIRIIMKSKNYIYKKYVMCVRAFEYMYVCVCVYLECLYEKFLMFKLFS